MFRASRIVLAVLLLAASAARGAASSRETVWAWTGRELLVLAEKGALRIDPESGVRSDMGGLPFKIQYEEGHRRPFAWRTAVLPLSTREVAVACVADDAAVRVFTWTLEPEAWFETARIRFAELGLEWTFNSVLLGMVRVDGALALIMNPGPDKTVRTETNNPPVIVPRAPSDARAGSSDFEKGDALYAQDGRVILWGCSRQRNYGFLWRARDDLWERMPVVPGDESSPRLTPRYGFSHCFTGSRLFIYGGHLAWSSAICSDGDRMGGMAYSLEEKTWRVLPGDGPGYGSLCWTGREIVAVVAEPRYQAWGARFDSETWEWKAMSVAGAPTFDRYPSCTWTGKEVLVFATDVDAATGKPSFSGSVYDPAGDRWREIRPSSKEPEKPGAGK